jgi:nucleolar protein 56
VSDETVLFETEAGMVLLQGTTILAAEKKRASREQAVARIAQRALENGVKSLRVADTMAAQELGRAGFSVSLLTEKELEELNSQKIAIIVRARLAADDQEALDLVRQGALEAAEKEISKESSREDLQLVHAIQALDELDRFLNITTERVAEWYSLHFPELQQMMGDNLALAKMIIEIGSREGFTEEKLDGKGLSDKKIEAILLAAERSKGGKITERDLGRMVGLAQIAVLVSSDRDKMAEYVESTMKRIAPNTTNVAGATIGARLIARAGGLENLARLPASTIQVLGAEKALFRALRTGARPPKHGVLFQHDAVHSAPKWQRGKIARALANKIAIAARIDFYRGEKEDSLTATLEKRLDEIRVKYKEPRETVEPKRSFRDDKRPRYGKGRKGRDFHKEPRSGQQDVRRRPHQDRRY